MDVRNRMANVVKLRCNACQDFLKLVIQPNWQQNLYNKAEREVMNNTTPMKMKTQKNYIFGDSLLYAI